MTISPPPDLTRDERARFRRTAASLERAGIDPPAEMVADYVRSDARLAALRAEEKATQGKARAAATRALNVAQAEKRRLHNLLFRGAAPAAAHRKGLPEETEADRMWRRYLHHHVHEPSSEELERRFGGPSWLALWYANPKEQAKGERIIEQSYQTPRKRSLRTTDDE